jgi:WD40 repeat protein
LTQTGHLLIATKVSILEWSPASPKTLREVPLYTETNTHRAVVHFSKQSPSFIVGDEAGLRLWDAATVTPKTLVLKQPVDEIEFSRDGTRFSFELCGASLLDVVKTASTECEVHVHSTLDASRIARVPVPNQDPQLGIWTPSSLSPSGAYLLLMRTQEFQWLSVATGKRALLRKGGRFVPGDAIGKASRELLEFTDDTTLLFSRFGMLELDDLKTGKVLFSQRYAASQDEDVRHVVSPDRKRVATFLQGRGQVAVWDWSTGKPAQTFALGKDVVCNTCEVSVSNSEIIRVEGATINGANATISIDAKAKKVVEDTTPETNSFQSTFFAEDGMTVRENANDFSYVVVAPEGSSTHRGLNLSFESAGNTLVVTGKSMVRVFDRRAQTIFQLGTEHLPPSRDPSEHNGYLPVARQAALGLRRPDKTEIWLEQPSAPATSTLLANGERSKDEKPQREFVSETHRFQIEYTRKGEATLKIFDVTKAERLNEPIHGYLNYARTHVEGAHIAMEMRLDRGGSVLTVCSVGVGCREIPDIRNFISMKWPWILVTREGEGAAAAGPKIPQGKLRGGRGNPTFALHNLDKSTETAVRLADSIVPALVLENDKQVPIIVAFGMEEKHVLVVQTPTGEVLWEKELLKQEPFHGFPFPIGASTQNSALIANPYTLAKNEFLRLNFSERSLTRVLAFPRATLELYTDETIRLQGDPASLTGAVWCRMSPADASLVPFEACRAELERK